MKAFTLHHTDTKSQARLGTLHTFHGDVPTPVFMPVGTQATVKTLDVKEVDEVSEGLILGNTYHLWLQPGEEIVANHGGLHEFMRWPKALLTDSGGYQVFSLANQRKIAEEGVHFKHHKSGESLFLSPEKSIQIQEALGADIVMSFDECPPFHASYDYHQASLERTLRWAERGKSVFKGDDQWLFGIVQGGPHHDLRQHSLKKLQAIGFDGYAIGGLSVGETKDEMNEVLTHLTHQMPDDKPRYLMGVGTPEDLLMGIAKGIDMFDCVNPTRLARHGSAYTLQGRIAIKAKKYATDLNPIELACQCDVCQTYTRSYLRHLFKANETLGQRLVSYHNLHFLKTLMAQARDAIKNGHFTTYMNDFLSVYKP